MKKLIYNTSVLMFLFLGGCSNIPPCAETWYAYLRAEEDGFVEDNFYDQIPRDAQYETGGPRMSRGNGYFVIQSSKYSNIWPEKYRQCIGRKNQLDEKGYTHGTYDYVTVGITLEEALLTCNEKERISFITNMVKKYGCTQWATELRWDGLILDKNCPSKLMEAQNYAKYGIVPSRIKKKY